MPSSSEFTLRIAPVAALLISILAPATPDPLGSVMWPERLARNSWARTIPPRQANKGINLDIRDCPSEASARIIRRNAPPATAVLAVKDMAPRLRADR